MTHAEMVLRGRREHVRPAVCAGSVTRIQARPHWARGVAEEIYQCHDCQAVLGLVGSTVEWTMDGDDWRAIR